ncbi:PH domain-containing protein [Chitiniphilus eburneus]|uniref:PH domain-containing protein n=1 Tax=Chitiniphilus eburneus TaxID=2571148 RepID=A0A4U0P9A9_9NEIS|nr:PH domain-containing protein [Chitiniphilus eburneus]TJZ64143.1 PH domain-containing protein [Chitiniphilus eburneus]
MFKKLAAEALGLSDIGVIVAPADYDKVDADDYLFHEDGERIFFLIKSKKDEYCFTNFALIHVEGDSAVSSRRAIKRYDFASHRIGQVSIETAGTIDLDIELKFTMDDALDFSIDVRKSFLTPLKAIYKALITIGTLQYRDAVGRDNAFQCLEAVSSLYKAGEPGEGGVARQFDALLAALNDAVLVRHARRDFSAVFEQYVQA